MATSAIYPGTFDPMTLGHVDIAKRAAKRFEQLIVAIAPSNRKTTLFSLELRLRLAKEILAAEKNIQVLELKGLLVTFAKDHKAQVIIRGIRNISDVDYELQMVAMNRVMAPEIETLFLTPNEKYAMISATMVREIATLGGDISPFVPECVVNAWRS